jgi:hypothetical protein
MTASIMKTSLADRISDDCSINRLITISCLISCKQMNIHACASFSNHVLVLIHRQYKLAWCDLYVLITLQFCFACYCGDVRCCRKG